MKLSTLALIAALTGVASAQSLDFPALAEKAKSKVELNLDGAVLDAARAMAPQGEKLAGLRNIAIRVYEYAKAGEYPAEALDRIRQEAESGAGWSRLVNARESNGERVDIFLKATGGKVEGFLLVAAEAKEVVVIRAEGSVELASLQEVVASAIQYDLAALTQQGK